MSKNTVAIGAYAGVRFLKNERKDDRDPLEISDNGPRDPVHTSVKIRLVAEDAFFGPGVCELLELIHQTGSLQEACAHMGLSYSKGSRMVKKLDRKLGFPVVERWTGGSGGGGSILTKEGLRLVESFRKMEEDVQRYTEEAFQKYFGPDFPNHMPEEEA